jgi:hypothetical protein
MKWLKTFAVALAVAAIAGCGGSSPSGPTTTTTASEDQAESYAALAAAPELIDDGLLEREDVGFVRSAPAFDGTLASIHPLRFWRVIRRIDKQFEIAFSDTDSTGRPTRAIATVRKTLHGTFVIVAGDSGGGRSDSTRRVVRKPLLDHWTRRLQLVRVPRRDDEAGKDRSVWRVAATSGVNVSSDLPEDPAAHAQIQSIRIQSGALDTTIVNPRELFRLRQILKVEAGASVTLTVTTSRNDDIVFLMAYWSRFRLAPQGDGTYSGTFRVPRDRGVRHFGVNALARSTLWDDAAPYDSHAWIFPYAVRGEVLAEYRP